MPSPRPRREAIDRQLLDDPAIAAALDAKRMAQWQLTLDQLTASREENLREPRTPTPLPWGSRFDIAVSPVTGERHASGNHTDTLCGLPGRDFSLAGGAVGPGGTWLRPDCPECLQVIEAWEAAHA